MDDLGGIPYPLPAGVDFPDRHQWPVTLRAGGVVLRPLRWRDHQAWRELREGNQDWLAPWDPTAPPDCDAPPRSYQAMLRHLVRQADLGVLVPWAVGWDPEGVHADRAAPLVGQLSLGEISYGSARHASIGYWIDEGHAGRNIIPTAVALAADYAFAVMRLHRLEICLCAENTTSRRVVDKLGFRHEGMRPDYLHVGGRWRDHDVFALHEDEAQQGLLVRARQLGFWAD